MTAKLIAEGLVYPCYETPEELELMRKTLLAKGRPPIYDRRALSLTKEQIAAYERKAAGLITVLNWRPATSSGKIWCAAAAIIRRKI